MYKLLLSVAIFCIALNNLNAQTIAGDIPFGMVSSFPNFSMSVSVINSSLEDSLDINCDGNFDIAFKLYKGTTNIDGANTLEMMILNPSYDFCNYFGNWASILQFYNFGDTMNCSGQSNWNNDTIMLGNYGCMLCSENAVINNKFIAYRKNTNEYGWIKLSHNLQDGGSQTAPVTLTVHEIVSTCLANSIIEKDINSQIKIATIDSETLTILGLTYTIDYQIISVDGRLLENGKTSSTIDISNLPTGVWILKMDGLTAPARFVKQ